MVTKMKSSMEAKNSGKVRTKKSISELEDRTIEITKSE